MRVNIYDVADNGTETLRTTAWLDEIFDASDDERHIAADRLRREGRYWTGGGAAPLVVLRRVFLQPTRAATKP